MESREKGASDSPGAMSSPSHLLIEGVCHAALKRPINASPRIKYTCLSVSSSHIALGCSTGSIYVFERCSLQHVQMVSAEAKDGSIVALSLASSGAALAYATSSGVVVIVDLHLEKRTKPEKLRVTTDHKGASVTALCWDERRVFVGDSNGLVTAVNSGTKASDLLKVPSEVIMRLDQPVVQIDVLNNRVLVSTTKTAYVANTSTQKFNQVGKKIRDGPYGACFYPVTGANSVPIVYSARPGSRVWEACSDGDVFNTHQFKALLNIPPSPIIPCSLDGFHIEASPLPGPQSLAFRQLYLLGNHFILAVTSTHLIILDPADVKVVLWTREFQDMLGVVCVKRDIYILLPNNTVRLFAFTSVVKYLIEASKSQSAQTALHHLFCESEFWVLKTISRRPEMLKIAEEILQQNISNEFKLNVERIRDELENKLELMKAKDEHKTFNRNESGIYVLERSSSIGSDDAESEVLMERVRQKRPEEDALSVSSNTSVNGAQKIEERLKEAKNKLTGLKNIIQDKVKRRVSDSVSQSSKVTTPTKEVTAESPNSLKRVNSSESLLSLEMKQSEDDESQKLSRRGSFTSNDVSESSSEILGSSSSSFDPEPVFAKSVASFSYKGKKKKAVMVDFDSCDSTPAAVPGKKKKSKQLKGRTIQKSISLPEQLKEHQNQDFSAAYTSSQELDASEESGEVSVSKSSPQGVVSTLNSVKDRVEGQARSFVHLIKEGASKVRGPPKGEAIEVDPKTIATMSKETVVWSDRSFMERVEEDCPEGDLDERSKVNHPEPYLVDLSDLREATTAAQEKLSPDLNPSEILKEWIFVLNRTLQNLHATLITDQQNSQNSSDVSDSPELDRVTDVTFPDFQIPSLSEITDVVPSHFLEHLRNPLYAKDPLKMDEILREQVELLTSLCLEHRVFGNISKYLDRDEDEKDESVVFVRCYFYLLTDAALEKFIQNSKERTTREKRWNFVVDCEQVAGKWERRLAVYLEKDDFAGAMNYLTYLKEKGRFRYTRGLLPSLLKISAPDCIEMLSNSKVVIVHPLDVLFLIRRSSGSDSEALLTRYVEEYVKHREDGIRDVCSEEEVLLCCMDALLHDQTTFDLAFACSCGFPSPQEHTRKWKHDQLIDCIINHVVKNSSKMLDSLKSLTFSYRYWPGHLHLLKADSTASCKLLQMLLLQLADEELLFRDFPVQSGDDWLKLVQLRKLQTFSNGSPNCLKCKSPLQMIADPCVVPWEALARRAMKSLGVLRGWGLLKDTEMPAHLLSGEFFHEVVQANAAEHKQSQLLEDLLRDFEADHTCRQPATIPPQVLMAARLEISSSNKDVATSMLINSLLSCLHSKEKSTGHWSSSLDISRPCSCCHQPLSTTPSLAIPGMVLLPCGHNFHRFCALTETCIICSDQHN